MCGDEDWGAPVVTAEAGVVPNRCLAAPIEVWERLRDGTTIDRADRLPAKPDGLRSGPAPGPGPGADPGRLVRRQPRGGAGPRGRPGPGRRRRRPAQSATRADPTFKALFNSWKRLDTLQDGVFAVPSDKPVRTAAFTSSYGVRSDPFQGRAAMHAGIDLAGPVGTPIYATADGTVSTAGWNNGGYGILIKLDHGRGIQRPATATCRRCWSTKASVRRGDLIARMGSTGRSTGGHLHYEVRIDGRAR